MRAARATGGLAIPILQGLPANGSGATLIERPRIRICDANDFRRFDQFEYGKTGRRYAIKDMVRMKASKRGSWKFLVAKPKRRNEAISIGTERVQPPGSGSVPSFPSGRGYCRISGRERPAPSGE